MPEGIEAIVARLLARSTAARTAASSLQGSTRVVVTVLLDRLHRKICITGKSPLPSHCYVYEKAWYAGHPIIIFVFLMR